MKILFIFSFTIILLSACSKRDSTLDRSQPDEAKILPEMMITELNDAKVKQGESKTIDLNRDGIRDIAFATWYIGNPNENEDEVLFFASTGTESALMLGGENDSPRLGRDEMITEKPFSGFDWYVIGQAELAKKNTGLTGAPYWEKPWKNANHEFLAVRVNKNSQWFYGWVEISMDTANDALILHRAAIGMVAGKQMKTGV
ncbi:hypothetical protein LZZ85_22180 [Terrimonas sp. NA20]|uniref:Uncharacterized protein n=1 Tax=Terrimonas ginsenosidimutans TaxID=2908004 RepID=A0ABS9KXI3_9BACT|nr:hypothetical protein [Terrimonas ginsenosidimutans]MCG2617020.1 hypothetical protein [Terrimonas ginsenosidimutans]